MVKMSWQLNCLYLKMVNVFLPTGILVGAALRPQGTSNLSLRWALISCGVKHRLKSPRRNRSASASGWSRFTSITLSPLWTYPSSVMESCIYSLNRGFLINCATPNTSAQATADRPSLLLGPISIRGSLGSPKTQIAFFLRPTHS